MNHIELFFENLAEGNIEASNDDIIETHDMENE